MQMLDHEIGRAIALVIDGNPTSRSIVAAQLRDLGVAEVTQANRLIDGRRRLETRRYDIVICEQQFPGEDQTGRELLDDLRRDQMLPYGTVFIMITGEARYSHVAEAAESALDTYLLKPFSASVLADRLLQARRRKRALGSVFEAIEERRFDDAALLCQQRFDSRGEYWLYAARIGAELWLRAGQHDQAQAMFEAILNAKAVPWARLGVARAQADAGQLPQARSTLESLISGDPSYADAYDVMGRVQIEQGRLDEALETYRHAAELTPGSIGRLQKQGMLAFYSGELAEAEEQLDRATLLGITSKMYDWQTCVLLAFVRFRLGDVKGLQRCHDNLAHQASKTPDNARITRFEAVVEALVQVSGTRAAEAVRTVQALAAQRSEPDFDIEAASNLLNLLTLLTTREVQLEGMSQWVEDIGLRFSTSRSITELLVRSAKGHETFERIIAAAQAQVQAMSESGLAHALEGRHGRSVEAMLNDAEQTLNAKLLDTARRTLERYRARIADAAVLEQRVQHLRDRYARSWAAPRLGQSQRPPGGLPLRDGRPAAESAPRDAVAASSTV